MNKKNFMDMMICSLSAAIIILCFTYMEQSRGRDTLMAVCGIVFLTFLLLAVTDSLSGRQKKRGNGRGIQELLLLDEEGNEISAGILAEKTSRFNTDGLTEDIRKTWTLIFRIQSMAEWQTVSTPC